MATASGSGLERLQWLGSVDIIQKYASCKGNEYVVQSEGKELFSLKEDGHLLYWCVIGMIRGFDMHGMDTAGRTVFSLRRPNALMAWWDKVELYMNNTLMCVVRKENTLMAPIFNIHDGQDCPKLMVTGEVLDYFHYNFQLQTRDKTTIGGITKKFGGILKELFTFNDNYVITFPVDLDVHFKLAVIGACILIDYHYHET